MSEHIGKVLERLAQPNTPTESAPNSESNNP